MAASELRLFVGTQQGHVHTLVFTPPTDDSPASLRIEHSCTSAGSKPTWLSLHPIERIAYASDESADNEGQGSIISLEISADGSLIPVGKTQSGGAGAVSTSVSSDGRNFVCANYLGANFSSFLVQPNGILWPSSRKTSETWTRSTPGPVADRQDASHPHSAAFSPDGRYIYSCDLGMDVVRVWSIARNGVAEPLPSIEMAAGSGPRHTLWLTPSGEPRPSHLFVICELANEIHVFAVEHAEDPSTPPSHTLKQVISTLAPDATKANGQAAELALTPDRRFLIASNRDLSRPDVPDTLAVFSVSTAAGTQPLTLARLHDTGLKDLRHFSLSADGRWLAVGGQGSDVVAVLEVDAADAAMREVARVGVQQPALALWRHAA